MVICLIPHFLWGVVECKKIAVVIHACADKRNEGGWGGGGSSPYMCNDRSLIDFLPSMYLVVK